MTEAESNKVIAEYVELQKLMAVARRRMMDGDRISLATITKRTKRFCDHVTSLIPEERIRFSDRLGSLVTDLDLLEVQLHAQQEAIAAQ